MWATRKRYRIVIVLFCCCFVLLAATAHLLHASHIHHKHGKAVADLASAFVVHAITFAAYVPPVLAALLVGSQLNGALHHTDALLEIQIGRAPPACA
jgi:hypothetical protein